MSTVTPEASSRRLRVAMVAHFAYGALSGSGRGHIGGVENQVTMMARWLAARGHEVSLLTWDEGQPEGVVVDGVRVLKLGAERDGVPVLRFVYPRWSSLCAALSRADADVYYQNCGEYVTGQVALWCRLHRRSFVYSSASDADCDGRLPLMPEFRVRALYRLGLKYADRIIVQNARQQRMMRDGFERDATVIAMPCAAAGAVAPLTAAERGTVVWIGRICRVKRPDRFIDVAKMCPELRFIIVGPPDDDADYVREIAERAAAVPNVTMRGAATRDEINRLLNAAGCLCCTSDHEGFPNTFLEAWSHGRPVVSTWDPDGIIAARALGIAADGAEGVANALRSLLASDQTWTRMSGNAKHYFEETHDIERVMPRFERVFMDAAGFPVAHGNGAVGERVAG
jgi:glycosyltransferase involved in cell wall biosynthesis